MFADSIRSLSFCPLESDWYVRYPLSADCSDRQGFVTGPADILNSMDVTTASKLPMLCILRKLIISELPSSKFHLSSSSIQAPQELGSRWVPIPLGRRGCILRRAPRKVRVFR